MSPKWPTRRPQDASELLAALEQFSNELPRSRTQESRSSTATLDDSHGSSIQRGGFDAAWWLLMLIGIYAMVHLLFLWMQGLTLKLGLDVYDDSINEREGFALCADYAGSVHGLWASMKV